MGLWGAIKKGFKKATSWIGDRVGDVWGKVPEFKVNVGVDIDAKIRHDSADFRIGLEAIGKGLDSVGAGLQRGLTDLGDSIGANIGTLGVSLSDGVRSAGEGVRDGLEAVGKGIENFDITGGINRGIVQDIRAARERLKKLLELRHFLDTGGQPVPGDHFSIRFRNESDVLNSLEVDAILKVGSGMQRLQFTMDQTPKPNDAVGWEQIVTVPIAAGAGIPFLHSIAVRALEPVALPAKLPESREPVTRVSADVFRVSDRFEHYVGGASYVSPLVRKPISAPGSLGVYPQEVVFDDTEVGTAAPDQRFTIINRSGNKVEFAFSPSPLSPFELVNPDTSIDKNTTVTITVRFLPTDGGGTRKYTLPLFISFGNGAWGDATVVLKGASHPKPQPRTLKPVRQDTTLEEDLAVDFLKGWVEVSDRQFDSEQNRFFVTIESETILCAPISEWPLCRQGEKCQRPCLYILQRAFSGTIAEHKKPAVVHPAGDEAFQGSSFGEAGLFRLQASASLSSNPLTKLLDLTEQKLSIVAHATVDKLKDLQTPFAELWALLFGTAGTLRSFRQEVAANEQNGRDSNVLFVLRIGRIVETEVAGSAAKSIQNVGCRVNAAWKVGGGNVSTVGYDVLVSGENIIPIQRPDAPHGTDWTELEIEVKVTDDQPVAIVKSLLEFQVAQVFLSDADTIETLKGRDLGNGTVFRRKYDIWRYTFSRVTAAVNAGRKGTRTRVPSESSGKRAT